MTAYFFTIIIYAAEKTVTVPDVCFEKEKLGKLAFSCISKDIHHFCLPCSNAYHLWCLSTCCVFTAQGLQESLAASEGLLCLMLLRDIISDPFSTVLYLCPLVLIPWPHPHPHPHLHLHLPHLEVLIMYKIGVTWGTLFEGQPKTLSLQTSLSKK